MPRPLNHPVKPGPDWLRQKYEVERLDCTQLAAILGCDNKTAWAWVREAGIITRKRGYGHPQNQFVKGEPSRFKGLRWSEEDKVRIGRLSRGRNPYANRIHWLHIPGAKPGNWKGGITAERQTFYRSPEWKAAVSVGLARLPQGTKG